MVLVVLFCRAGPVNNGSLQIFAEWAKTRVKGEKWGQGWCFSGSGFISGTLCNTLNELWTFGIWLAWNERGVLGYHEQTPLPYEIGCCGGLFSLSGGLPYREKKEAPGLFWLVCSIGLFSAASLALRNKTTTTTVGSLFFKLSFHW